MTSLPLPPDAGALDDRMAFPAQPPFAVQFVGQIAFGIFAIVATALAFHAHPLAGTVLAIALIWHGFGLRPSRRSLPTRAERRAQQRAAPVTTTGNAAFDSYKADMLKRLEDERESFVEFLNRLRTSKDQSEFDAFMQDRARAARSGVTAPELRPPAA